MQGDKHWEGHLKEWRTETSQQMGTQVSNMVIDVELDSSLMLCSASIGWGITLTYCYVDWSHMGIHHVDPDDGDGGSLWNIGF
jgi:hypothetical protein